MATNPLNLLGVPRWAVDIAVATDDYAAVRAMAEAGFRAISRYFHPDRGGDEEFYGQFAAAIEELRDDDALTVACQFYAAPTAATSRVLASQAKRLRDSQALAVKALAGVLVNVNQLSVFGADNPTVALLRDWRSPNYSYVLRMYSATLLRFSQAAHGQWLPVSRDKMVFRDDAWHEPCVETAGYDVTTDDEDSWSRLPMEVRCHEEIRSRDDLVIVGGVPSGSLPQGYETVIVHLDQLSLTTSASSRVEISWSLPGDTWWLPNLQPSVEIGDHVAVLQPESGQLALLPPLVSLVALP